MIRSVLLLICFTCDYVISQDDRSGECPSYWHTYSTVYHDNRCFQLYNKEEEWVEAKAYCSQRGGRLVTIDDPDTFAFLQSTLQDKSSWGEHKLWIGLNEITNNGDWNWINYHQEPENDLTWSHWDRGYPKGKAWYEITGRHCAFMNKGGGSWYWQNTNCNSRSKRFKFICEYDLPPVTTAIVPTTTLPPTTLPTEFPSTTLTLLFTTNPTSNKFIKTDLSRVTVGDTMVTEPDMTSRISTKSVSMKEETLKDISQYLPNQATNDGSVPRYTIILGFIAGISIVITVTVIAIVRCRRKDKTKDQPSEDDLYLTTCTKSGQPGRRSPGQTRALYICDNGMEGQLALPNDYDDRSNWSLASQASVAKPALTNASEVDSPPKDADSDLENVAKECCVCGTLKRANPTLAGSLSRGRLPERPTDAGYEIPVSLLRGSIKSNPETHGKPEKPLTFSPSEEANKSGMEIEDETDGDSQDHDFGETAEHRSSGIYYEIPEMTEKNALFDDKVYQSIA